MLSSIPIYQISGPTHSREHSPVRSQIPTSPLATRKVLSQLPQAPNRKHHLSGLPVPDAKRTTLAQRAGDFSRPNAAAPPSNQPVNHAVTSTAATGMYRFNASSSTRTSPPRGRSTTSFSASVGSGIRPQTFTSSTRPRPAVAHGRIPRHARSTTNTSANGLQTITQQPYTARADENAMPNGVSSARTIVTTSTREGTREAPIAKGKLPFPSSSKPALVSPFNHNTNDLPRNDVRVTSFHSRPVLISPLPKCLSELRDLSLSSAMRGLKLDAKASSDLQMQGESPSKLPRPVTPAPVLFSTPLPVSKSRRRPPKLKQFLTRDSNTAAWDPDDMFASMERVMSESLGKLQQNTQDSSSMKELLDMYKARRKFPCLSARS